jgi:DNA-binding NarL/FixJ family response regulator
MLTRREQEVLSHVVAGRTYAEIASELFLSEKTVSTHITNILRKAGTANRVELADWAQRGRGVVP